MLGSRRSRSVPERDAGTTHVGPAVRLDMVPHDGAQAVVARGRFAASRERMRRTLLDFPRFAEWLPLIERGSIEALASDRWCCGLHGRIGIWKLGVPIDMRFEMTRVGDDELVMTRYLGGSFRRLHFHHRLSDGADGGGELESLYFFDVEGFPLLGQIPSFRHHPWLCDEIQLAAASMMVRGLIRAADAAD